MVQRIKGQQQHNRGEQQEYIDKLNEVMADVEMWGLFCRRLGAS